MSQSEQPTNTQAREGGNAKQGPRCVFSRAENTQGGEGGREPSRTPNEKPPHTEREAKGGEREGRSHHRASSQQTPKPERGAMPSKALAVFSAGPRTRKGGRGREPSRTPNEKPPTHGERSKGGGEGGAQPPQSEQPTNTQAREGGNAKQGPRCVFSRAENTQGGEGGREPSRTPNENPPPHGERSKGGGEGGAQPPQSEQPTNTQAREGGNAKQGPRCVFSRAENTQGGEGGREPSRTPNEKPPHTEREAKGGEREGRSHHRASSQQTPKPERGAMPSKALAVFSAGPRTRKGGREGGSRAGHQTRTPPPHGERSKGGGEGGAQPPQSEQPTNTQAREGGNAKQGPRCVFSRAENTQGGREGGSRAGHQTRNPPHTEREAKGGEREGRSHHRASSQQTPKPERGAMPSKGLAVFSAGPRTRKGGAEQDTKRETPHTRREQRESPPPTHTKQSPRANERQHTTHTQHAHQGASLQPRRSKGARQVGSVWNSRHMKLKKPGPGGWQVVGAFHSAAPAALVVTKHKMIAESHQLVQAADKIVRHSKKRTRGVHAVLRVLLASSLIVSFFQGPARL